MKVKPSLRAALTVLAGALLIANIGLVGAKTFAEGLLPDSWTAAERADERNAEIRAAASKAMTTFIDVDYKTIDDDLDAMSRLSTALFKEEFEKTKVEYAAKSRQERAVGTGEIKSVGIVDADDDRAVVLVALNQTVLNRTMRQLIAKGEKPDNVRLYTFQLTLERVDGRWLLAKLEVVS